MVEIRFDAAGVSFEGRVALAPLSLTLRERRIGVIGLNGSGKTTFAKLINGLVKPTTGHVRVDGLDTVAEADAVLGRVGFVFQNPQNQLIMPGVAEDIAFGLSGAGLRRRRLPRGWRRCSTVSGLRRWGRGACMSSPAARCSSLPWRACWSRGPTS